jgi:glycosyltransferase involved in cell wall biosynthesis
MVVKLHTPHVILKEYYSSVELSYHVSGIEKIEEYMLRKADGISSPSTFLAHQVAEIYTFPEAEIFRIPNLIDQNFFSPRSSPTYNGSMTILYVGRLESRKGAVLFSKAIPIIAMEFPDSRFIFLGGDRLSKSGISQRAELKNQLAKEGFLNQVEFHGHAPPEVFRDHLRNATVFVMPSMYENCPYTLLEAMACGKPVVVSDSTGMPEIETGNPEALAAKTISLLKSPDDRERLGHEARKTILDHYALEVGALATESFYKGVIASSRNG